MFRKVLIANRGAIACRILRTLKKMSIASVCVYSEADSTSQHVLDADEAFCIGPAPAAESYLRIDKILEIAKMSGAQAVHPGYGFLSENIDFARACSDQDVVFIGPGIVHIEAFSLKHTARALALQCGVPLLPGTDLLASKEAALIAAQDLSYPVMLKSSAGGGGIGMRVCFSSQELADSYETVVRLSQDNFGDGSVYLEKFISRAKHIEVQIFGDGRGETLALGARDCSAQRRHQKVLEETPVPGLGALKQEQLFSSAILLGKRVEYRSAGTVEFIYDIDTANFYFLEVNTRLQVEHGITEQVTGLDLVQMMVEEAANELPPLSAMRVAAVGHSIEARIYAEDPTKDFRPAPGMLSHVSFPPASVARVETWVESGSEITPYYDPMLAKLIVTGVDRSDALRMLDEALAATKIYGTETNVRYLRSVVASREFVHGEITTSSLGQMQPKRNAIEIVNGGTQTTIQDYPGRLGYWHVGVPPSSPMDSLALRIANRIAGNHDGTAAFEMTGIGATFRFDSDCSVAIGGADMGAELDGSPALCWQPFQVSAGQVLKFSAAKGAGARTYLAVRGGLDVPDYLGSASTFMLGGFGGHSGRALRAGDVIHISSAGLAVDAAIPEPERMPTYCHHWQIGVLYGPHGSPEFFTDKDIEMIFSAKWRVHYQSDRTGIRLVGPKPEWAREDGGEAGLHPSNIHDNAYAIGSIDFTGDMPILLGPDGPSLGGFVCPAVVVSAELWKLGQLKAGDTVQFQCISEAQAQAMQAQLESFVENLNGILPQIPEKNKAEPAILRSSKYQKPASTYRADGDKYLLVEYGDKVLDLELRLRVHLVEQGFRALDLDGVIDVTPGVRSLQIHYDNRKLPRQAVLEALESANTMSEKQLDVSVPSRTVYMPLSWNDPATQMAQTKYMQSVRPDAPWCPDNIEFIRRINGLNSVEQVYEIVHAASYLVLGLGDVYLGAPVATPTDPRHRLVTTKYNPARTWTPENAVGIGGAYMCVYGMEGPGGYQLVGRTVQVWNTYRSTNTFQHGTPWALRCFDKIRFYPVSNQELTEMRSQILHGGFDLKTEDGSFNLRSYQEFLESVAPSADAFRLKQRTAFQDERERWRINGLLDVTAAVDEKMVDQPTVQTPEGCELVTAPMTASVFQISVEVGQNFAAGARLIVLDAMKTEVVISAPRAGVVEELQCAQGKLVHAGQALLTLRFESKGAK